MAVPVWLGFTNIPGVVVEYLYSKAVNKAGPSLPPNLPQGNEVEGRPRSENARSDSNSDKRK